MLRPCHIPGLFITATDTGVGKTILTAAIAAHLKSLGKKVGVCKPIATGCIQQGENLISEDAELLARHAGGEFSLDTICPQRYAEPLAPAVAAQRENRTVDWAAIQHSLDTISASSDLMLIEGVGGVMVPLDSRHTVLDMIRWLGMPAVVVGRPSLGTINHTLLTINALRSSSITIAGIIINRMPAAPDLAERTNSAAIEKFAKARVLAMIPETAPLSLPDLPAEMVAPLSNVDWQALLANTASS